VASRIKSPSPGKSTARAASKRGAAKAGSSSAAAKTAAKSSPGVPIPRVSMVTAGGYTVFSSPVQPMHRTKKQIAEAIADLD